jgi:hypothetical protein
LGENSPDLVTLLARMPALKAKFSSVVKKRSTNIKKGDIIVQKRGNKYPSDQGCQIILGA